MVSADMYCNKEAILRLNQNHSLSGLLQSLYSEHLKTILFWNLDTIRIIMAWSAQQIEVRAFRYGR
jgi:hypothetical protein